MKSTNPKPSPAPDPDTIFAQLLQDLPPETAQLARTFQAFTRARKIQTPEQLLRVVLLFAALDYSERAIAANLLLVDPRLGQLSNQAVRERLAACLPWLQALLDVVTMQLAGVHLTDGKTGETLCNFTFQAGAVVLTDRGYSHRRGVAQVVASGGAVLTRYNPHHIPLVDAQGQALDSADWLTGCERGLLGKRGRQR
jgi:hypothetical protein